MLSGNGYKNAMFAAGSVIDGKFEVVRRLGEGGFGQVLLARQVAFDRLVAIKVIKESDADEEAKARFEREAKLLATLNHPNIAMFLGFGMVGGFRYTVMEYVPGTTLEEFVLKQGRLNAEQAVSFLKQILSALAQAHSNGIVHRDLKPANVLIDDAGKQIKLIDFGLAHIFEPARQRLTREGCAIGTVAYMAPEQCMGHLPDARSDLYAAGCIFYFMLSGRAPFVADDSIAVMYRHMNEDFPSLSANKGSVADDFLARLVAKTPTDRFDSAEQALSELNAQAKQLNGVILTAASSRASKSSLRLNKRKLMVAFTATSFSLIIAAGLIAFNQLALHTPPVHFAPRISGAEISAMPPVQVEKLLMQRLDAAKKAIDRVVALKAGEQDPTDRGAIESELLYIVNAAQNKSDRRDLLASGIAYMYLSELPWASQDTQNKYIHFMCGELEREATEDGDVRAMHAHHLLQQMASRYPDNVDTTVSAAKVLGYCMALVKEGNIDEALTLIREGPFCSARLPTIVSVIATLNQQKEFSYAADLAEQTLQANKTKHFATPAEQIAIGNELSTALDRLWRQALAKRDAATAFGYVRRAMSAFDLPSNPFRCRWHVLEGNSFEIEKNWTEAEKRFKDAYLLAKLYADWSSELHSLRGLARAAFHQKQFARAIDYSERSLAVAREHESAIEEKYILEELDSLKQGARKPSAAEKNGIDLAFRICDQLSDDRNATKAVETIKNSKLTNTTAFAAINLLKPLRETYHDDTATCDLAEYVINADAKSPILSNVEREIAYDQLFWALHRRWEKARDTQHLEESVTLSMEGDKYFMSEESRFRHVWLLMHSESQASLRNYTEAIKWAKTSAPLCAKAGDTWMQMWATKDIANCQFEMHDYKAALQSYNEALDIAEHHLFDYTMTNPQLQRDGDFNANEIRSKIELCKKLLAEKRST